MNFTLAALRRATARSSCRCLLAQPPVQSNPILRLAAFPTSAHTARCLHVTPRTRSQAAFSEVAQNALWDEETNTGGLKDQIPQTPKLATNSDSQQSNATFASVQALSPATQAALARTFKYSHMSVVQEQVLNLLPTNDDLLVRAKTGTGKTLAFVIAALESALAKNGGKRLTGDKISILVLSPTRELANQIATEAQKLLDHHNYRVQTAVGGPGRNRAVEKLARYRYEMLVATPGRLLDMLGSVPQVREKLEGLQTLIYDEADQMLDQGFSDAIREITSYLPRTRQTFMFSATLSSQVQSIARDTLREDFKYIDTVPDNEVPTHQRIRQTYVAASPIGTIPTLYNIIRDHQTHNPRGKIIVFFNTTKLVAYMAQVFNSLPQIEAMELHSGLSQQQRTKISDRFRRSTGTVLFTSDVSARGVDYPDVSLVIQVGAAPNREQYIHRLGRTGRAGKEGEGVMLVTPYEKGFVENTLNDLPIKEDLRFNVQKVINDDELMNQVNQARSRIDRFTSTAVFHAYIGNILQVKQNLSISSQTLSRFLDDFATDTLGFKEPPEIPPFLQDQLDSGARKEFVKRQRRDSFSFKERDFGRGGGFGSRDGGFGGRDHGFGRRDSGFGGRDGHYGGRDGGRRDGGYGGRDGGYGGRDGGYGGRDGGFGGSRHGGGEAKKVNFFDV
ncbi:hypothetical protein HDV00_001546 [Rhizophlyctis rosea]|nr:hypothetical protein HDV00_001546 [Rhizophlyctis rosea]